MLERHIIPKLTQGETDHLNRPISITEIQTIIILPEEKAPGPDFFTGELYQSFKKEMIPNLFSILQKRETEGTLPHSFFETRITPITKPEKDKKTTVQCISWVAAKILTKIIAHCIQRCIERMFSITN